MIQFISLHLYILISLYFIAKVTCIFFFFFLGHPASLCGCGVGNTRVALDARDVAQSQLAALKEKQAQMAEQVKDALRQRDNAEAGLKTTEKQVEDIRKELHYCEINMATEKQMVTELLEELRKAREAAQLLKKATEAEK